MKRAEEREEALPIPDCARKEREGEKVSRRGNKMNGKKKGSETKERSK